VSDPAVARAKLAQAKRYLSDSGIDCWLLLSREGSDGVVPFLTGGQTVGQAAYLIYPDGRDEAIVANYDEGHVALTGVIQSVRSYERGLRQPLVQTLRERGVTTIALNFSADDAGADTLTHGQYLWFAASADPSWKLVSAAPILSRVRAVKAPVEIERLRRVVQTTQEMFVALWPRLRPGMSEREIHQMFVDETARRGLNGGVDDTLRGPLVLLPKVGMAHRGPTDACLEPGDMLVIDFSLRMDGYASDVARTFYCLRPGEDAAPAEAEGMFRASRAAIDAAAAALRPGVRGHEVDAAARATLRDLGYPEPIHALGHTVGQRAHDGGVMLGPLWERYGDGPHGVVEANMVFALEPTVLPGGPYAVISEENVRVTADGIERLCDWQTELWLIRP
jgi:Xaa-Pro aminopeptidase